jgi:hypothetical protein
VRSNSANGQRDLAIDIEVQGDRVVGKGLWFRSNAKGIDDMGRGLGWDRVGSDREEKRTDRVRYRRHVIRVTVAKVTDSV